MRSNGTYLIASRQKIVLDPYYKGLKVEVENVIILLLLILEIARAGAFKFKRICSVRITAVMPECQSVCLTPVNISVQSPVGHFPKEDFFSVLFDLSKSLMCTLFLILHGI